MIRLIKFFLTVFAVSSIAFAAQSLSLDESKELGALMNEFTSSEDLNKSTQLVDKMVGIGPAAAVQVHKKVVRMLDSDLKKYLRRYLSGSKSTKLRLSSQEKASVKKDRKVLSELRAKGRRLTENEITSKGEPALERLRALLIPTHQKVIDSDEELGALRNDLLTVAGWERKCLAVMPKKKAGKNNRRSRVVAPPPGPRPFESRLAREERIVRASMFAESRDLRVLERNSESADKIGGEEAAGILDLNIIRLLADVSPVEVDVRLCDASRDHSRDMVEKNFFAHDSPVKGKRLFTDRAKLFGTSANGENIAGGNTGHVKTNLQWFRSPGHHVNMMNPTFTVIGLGRYKDRWTQMFRGR